MPPVPAPCIAASHPTGSPCAALHRAAPPPLPEVQPTPSCPRLRPTGELRFQELVHPSQSVPPYLLAKGARAGGFRAGAPVSSWGPPLPGYERRIASGLYGQPGTPCPDRNELG